MSTPMDQTFINPKWLLKMVIVAIVLLAFGAWGLYDASIAYPKRGVNYAEYAEWDYLRVIKQENAWERASVKDPVAELARLDERVKSKTNVSPTEKTRHEWLDALRIIHHLKADRTDRADAVKRFEELNTKWTTSQGNAKSSPKKLTPWDVPVQWLITAVGFGLGLYMVGLILSVKRIKYGWEPASQTLTLPSGDKLTPADIADFDKRKWSKFLIFLVVKPGHPTLGGKEVRLDLLRHSKLEEWVLAMEKTAFPENQEPTAPGGEPAPGGSPEPASASA